VAIPAAVIASFPKLLAADDRSLRAYLKTAQAASIDAGAFNFSARYFDRL
jgi:hypothetical protein